MGSSLVPGHCYCGVVQFEIDLPPKFVTDCHCEPCRRAHGAGAVTWVGVPEDQFRFTSGESRVKRFRTETGALRSFCDTCGSTLLFQSPRWAGEVHIARAHFDDDAELLPTAHSYADRAPKWCPIFDSMPRFGGPDGTTPIA